MYRRKYIRVNIDYDEEGQALPRSIYYRERHLQIDRLLDCRPAAATKAGGQGMRYTVRIGRHETYLFQDDQSRWFVEEKSDVHELSRVPGREHRDEGDY